MRTLATFLCILSGLYGLSSGNSYKSAESSYVVIVNVDNQITAISQKDLALIFLGKKTLWENETRIVPVMMREKQRPMRNFVEVVLNKSISQYRAYWKRRLFSGGGTIPKTFKTHKSLIDYVSNKPGAIGIIPKKSAPEGVKVIKIAKS